MKVEFDLFKEIDTVSLAHLLSRVLCYPISIYFVGEIGAGKTFFIRSLLKALGVKDRIKSPTFSLLEWYELEALSVCHVDLYRVADEEELYYIDFKERFDTASLRLVEWPEKVSNLPPPDLRVNLTIFDQGHHAVIESNTLNGEKVLRSLTEAYAKKC